MIIKNPELHWTKGDYGYKQGIKGHQNYRHMEGKNYFNGYGGARMNIKMELNITGKDENGIIRTVDVRHYLVEALGRKVMNDALFADLGKCLPEQLEVDDETGKLTEKTLNEIREGYEKMKE